MPAASSAGFMPTLVGSHGLDLDDFLLAVRLDDSDHDAVGFIRIARPVNLAAGTNTSLFELLEIKVEMPERVLFYLVASLAQLLPVRHFAHHARPFTANHRGGVANVVPQLGVRQKLLAAAGKSCAWAASPTRTVTARRPVPSKPGFRQDEDTARRCFAG